MPGTLTISTLSDGTNSTSATNCISGSAKAWVNYNGSTGTRNSSYNVSSVTITGTGTSTINLTNALADANLTVVIGVYGSSIVNAKIPDAGGITSSSIPILAFNTSFGAANPVAIYVAVFR